MKKYEKTSRQLLEFLEKCPTAFQAVDEMSKMLAGEGYTRLLEGEKWNLAPGNGYYVTRGDSALIAFFIPEKNNAAFHILASHSDSPTFKIKENPEMEKDGKYVVLNVERYGGMTMAPWFDRPLSVAGRLVVREDGRLVTKLVNVDRDMVMITNLAIHMNREVNDGYKYNAQKDMLPIYGTISAKGSFMAQIAKAAGVKEKDILGHDLFLYNRQSGSVWGADNEFLSAGRLDDLQCAYASLMGFLKGKKKEQIAVHCVFDNEEVGSGTKQGAASTFLKDVLMRINEGLGRTHEEYLMAVANSFMISADNGHALHPNYPEKADPINRPVINGGIVIKYTANQKYCTDGVSAAYFKNLCDEAGVPYQIYLNRSDVLGGSTLGNISGNQVALSSVDVGLAQLAMHSPYETVGVKDTQYMIEAARTFFS